MDKIFLNAFDNKTDESHKLVSNLRDKIDFRRPQKYNLPSNTII